MSNLDKRTSNLIAYLVHEHPKPSVTVLMKLCYFVDLVNIRKYKKPITDFEYIRYHFGPFDKKIYSYLEELGKDEQITQEQSFANETSNDFIVLSSNEGKTPKDDFLREEERDSVQKVLEEVGGYGAKALTDVAYKTKPMLKLGATRGGTEGMFQKLDMHA